MKLRALPIAVSVAGVLLVGLLLYGVANSSPSRTLDESLARGEHPLAPDANRALPRLAAPGTISLASLRGRYVLLNFWAHWCVPCEAEAPLLEHAQRELALHGGTVLGVTYKDIGEQSEQFVRRFHLSYPNARDGSGEFAAAFGTDRIPESFLINPQGRIVAISRGEIEPAFATQAAEAAG